MLKLNNIIKNKIDKLISEPGKVFGLVYPYMFILVTILGFLYVINLNYISRQNVDPPLPDTTAQSDLPVMQSKTIPPIDITKIREPAPDLIAKGKNIFTTVCSSCHGTEGKGDGPTAASLNPKPRNFTSKEGWKNGSKLSQIYKTLQDGIPGSGMASYEYLTPEEKFGLAHYIRTTFVPNPSQDSPDDLTVLDQLYNLSKGKEIPTQIPVAAAAKFVISENDSTVQVITGIMSTLSGNYSNPAVAIFDKITQNKFQALVSLERSLDWKENEQLFINTIVDNVNQNGFNRQVFNLTDNDWDLIYVYLKNVL
ncbi:MAG: cytochrome c [Ignavibacteriaceae bacterium]|nr:cytochrome c [Ignavibacteriaceae bacterium]